MIKSSILSLYIIVLIISIFGCIDTYSIRKKYYMASIKPYNIPSILEIGDSLKITLGDSIPFRYGKKKIGNERGELLIYRNEFNKLEFFELGQWTDYHYGDRISGKVMHDRDNGMIEEIGWNYYGDVVCSNYRIIKNDSLIEVQRWYHTNGKLKSEQKYYIKRGFNNRAPGRERKIKIGKWTSYNELGEVVKIQYH
jgi:hypothetical protein